MNIEETLNKLGFADGWAADHAKGILVWARPEPEPTRDELLAAGWVPAPLENANDENS